MPSQAPVNFTNAEQQHDHYLDQFKRTYYTEVYVNERKKLPSNDSSEQPSS